MMGICTREREEVSTAGPTLGGRGRRSIGVGEKEERERERANIDF